MQIKLFTIPISDMTSFEEELNSFLRSHKILELAQHIVSNERGASWCFCVKYVERGLPFSGGTKDKVDYRNILDEATFKKFSVLRELRKQIAAQDAVPAYMVFTDEELSQIAKLPEINASTIKGIKGIGDKKVEKYAERIVSALSPKN